MSILPLLLGAALLAGCASGEALLREAGLVGDRAVARADEKGKNGEGGDAGREQGWVWQPFYLGP